MNTETSLGMTERERLVSLIDQSPAHFCNGCYLSPDERAESVEKLADYLLAEDYRKASDVAAEIFAEIEKTIADLEYKANTPRKTVSVDELRAQVNWVLHKVVPETLANLKKKYTEDTE